MARLIPFKVAVVSTVLFVVCTNIVCCNNGRKVSVINLTLEFDCGLAETAPVSHLLSISFDQLEANGTFYFYYQVGDVLDTEFSGFSVPLEHSFEVGEEVI